MDANNRTGPMQGAESAVRPDRALAHPNRPGHHCGVSESLTVLRRYLDAWSAGDAETIVACFHPEARFRDPSMAQAIAGRHAIRKHVEKVLRYWPEEEWEVLRHWDHDTGVTLHWRATITSPWTGRDVTFDGLNVAEVSDGLIVELLVVFDPAVWRGLVPTPFVPPERPSRS